VVFQLVERHLTSRHDQLPVARLSDLERHLILQRVQMLGGNVVEPYKGNGGNHHRFAFGDRDGDVDGILCVVQLDVESGHARIRISTVGIERLNPLQVRIKARPVEKRLSAPGELRALAGGEGLAQAGGIHRLHPDKLD
jgi:hypothetical protein